FFAEVRSCNDSLADLLAKVGAIGGVSIALGVVSTEGLLQRTCATTHFSASFHGIWCLKNTASPTLVDVIPHGGDGLLDNLYWDTAAALPAAYQSQKMTELDAFMYEVAAGIEASGRSPRDFVESVGRVKTPALLQVTANSLNSPIPGFRSAAVALALMNNSPGAVAHLVSVWPAV